MRSFRVFNTDCSFIKTIVVLTSQFRTHSNCITGLTVCIDHSDEPQPTSLDCNILRNFIDCLSNLEYLTLDIWSLIGPFELNWINSHAKTLERLYIRIGSTTSSTIDLFSQHILPTEDVMDLCSTFTKLKQVAICLPEVDLLTEEGGKLAWYKSYLVTLFFPFATLLSFSNFRQTALASLPNLKILRIFTWPMVPLSCTTKTEDEDRLIPPIFNELMQEFAIMTVSHLTAGTIARSTPSKLKVVCFGDRHIWALEASDGVHYRANARCYVIDVKDARVSKDGNTSVAKAVTAKTAQDHVPDASAWHVPYGERVEEE